MGIAAYLIRRLAQLPLLLLLITILVFSLMHIAPGDPVTLMLGDYASPESEEALTKELGLDRPLYSQYLRWLWKASHGDLGQSIRNRRSVSDMILERLPNTITLAALAMLVTVLISIPVGIISAYKYNTLVDYVASFLVVAAISIPNFVLGLLLILVLAVHAGVLPISGWGNIFSDPQYYVMPVMTLASFSFAVLSRQLRSSMLDVLAEDYIMVARAKGLATLAVLWHHAFRNSLLPVLTMAGLHFGYMLGGAVIVEEIFGVPGLGSLLVRAVDERDFPLVQGIGLLLALFVVLVNLAVDLLYAIVDPRIQYE